MEKFKKDTTAFLNCQSIKPGTELSTLLNDIASFVPNTYEECIECKDLLILSKVKETCQDRCKQCQQNGSFLWIPDWDSATLKISAAIDAISQRLEYNPPPHDFASCLNQFLATEKMEDAQYLLKCLQDTSPATDDTRKIAQEAADKAFALAYYYAVHTGLNCDKELEWQHMEWNFRAQERR